MCFFFLSGMFDDFEFEDKFNPWDVKSLEDFLYYCCPSCPSKNMNKTDFINHALTSHPQSQSFIEFLENNTSNTAIVKTEEYVENLPFEVEDKFNPWYVKSLEEFHFYCCPECPSKNVNKTDFIKHVVTAHPQSQSIIESLEDNKAVIKTENNSSTKVNELSTCELNYAQNSGYKEADPIEKDFLLSKEVVVTLPKLSDAIVRKYTNVFEKNNFELSSKTHLNRHIKSFHENVRYNCDKCEKSYSWKGHLNRHIQAVHEKVGYNCEKCGKKS